MTDYTTLANYFKAFAHPVRLQILDLLRNGETCVCHIEAALQKRQAYISQQLMILRDMGLVETRKEGLQVYYRIKDERVYQTLRLLIGALEHPMHEVFEGCSCAHCTTASISN